MMCVMKLYTSILIITKVIITVEGLKSIINETREKIYVISNSSAIGNGTQYRELPVIQLKTHSMVSNFKNINDKNIVSSVSENLNTIRKNSTWGNVQQSASITEKRNTTINIKSSKYWYRSNNKCEHSDDCSDVKMVCRDQYCQCSRFHDWMPNMNTCVANLTKITLWLKKTTPNETDTVSHPVPFQVIQIEPYTILMPTWAEYSGGKQEGLGFIPPSLWPVIFLTVIVLIIYALILLDCL